MTSDLSLRCIDGRQGVGDGGLPPISVEAAPNAGISRSFVTRSRTTHRYAFLYRVTLQRSAEQPAILSTMV